MALVYNPEEPQYQQMYEWTCSACSLAWLNRALYIDYATDEMSAVEYIGFPDYINATYGLMDGSGARLAQCLREQGAPAFTCWPEWDPVLEMAREWPLLIGGVRWNHWVGVRTATVDILSLANSAPGWGGVTGTLNFDQWYNLGPFAVVAVPLLRNFPPT